MRELPEPITLSSGRRGAPPRAELARSRSSARTAVRDETCRARGVRRSNGSSASSRPRSPRSASPRCATGSSRGTDSTCASRTRSRRSTPPEASARCSSASRWGASSASVRRSIRPSRPCSGSRHGFPIGSISHRSSGSGSTCSTGALDRWLPGIPGVSPTLSRKGFERARRLGVEGTYTKIPGGVHGMALRARSGRPVTLPRARRWAELAKEAVARFETTRRGAARGDEPTPTPARALAARAPRSPRPRRRDPSRGGSRRRRARTRCDRQPHSP